MANEQVRVSFCLIEFFAQFTEHKATTFILSLWHKKALRNQRAFQGK